MRGVLQLFHKRSKDLLWNCSRTKLICSRTVLGKTFRIFWNFSRTNFLTSARTIVEQKIVPFSRKFLKVCSGSVLEKANVYSRTVLEQTIRTFLELFWNHSKNVLE